MDVITQGIMACLIHSAISPGKLPARCLALAASIGHVQCIHAVMNVMNVLIEIGMQVGWTVGLNPQGIRGTLSSQRYKPGDIISVVPRNCSIDLGPQGWTAPVSHTPQVSACQHLMLSATLARLSAMTRLMLLSLFSSSCTAHSSIRGHSIQHTY